MHCIFFDVLPKPGHMQHYFSHVERLKPYLARHRGLVYLERFRPLDDTDALMSHHLWEDEAAIAAWRGDAAHRASQSAGRRVHFRDYRIRVGSQELEFPGDGVIPGPDGRFVVASYGDAPGSHGGRSYESVTRPGRFMTLADASRAAAADALARQAHADGAETVRVFRIERDYTMTDRAEAPGQEDSTASPPKVRTS